VADPQAKNNDHRLVAGRVAGRNSEDVGDVKKPQQVGASKARFQAGPEHAPDKNAQHQEERRHGKRESLCDCLDRKE
jgi:hypothetical protein